MATPFGHGGEPDLWSMDGEWLSAAGCLPRPRLFCAVQHGTGRKVRLGEKELANRPPTPFPITDNTIVTSFSLAADMVLWRVMGWKKPRHKICTYAVHRTATNGKPSSFGDDLIGAGATVGIPYFHADVKNRLRARFQDPTLLSFGEEKEGLEYTDDDAVTGLRILEHYLPDLWWDRALSYGDYADCCAGIEFNGLPMDVDKVGLFSRNRGAAKQRVIEEHDREFRTFDVKGSQRNALVWEFARREGVPWPATDHGAPKLDDDTLKALGIRFPIVEAFRQLRKTVSAFRSNSLGIDTDGRCHTSLFPFATITGRNAPKGRHFPFAFPAWMRGMITAHAGRAIGYLDFSCEEFAIAAWLSGDRNMQTVYLTGDPYLAIGVLLGLAPKGATKRTHRAVRDLCKVLVLGISYGMSAQGLAWRAGISEERAADLLYRCRRAFPVFHEWADDHVARAKALHRITTDYGWEMYVARNSNPRSLRNWQMQSTGSDILRLCATALVHEGLQIDALIHDAVLIESPIADFDDHVRRAVAIMQRASEEIIGIPLRVDIGDEGEPHLFPYPLRFRDKREGDLYDRTFKLFEEIDNERVLLHACQGGG
jgi:DNA polymerase-1